MLSKHMKNRGDRKNTGRTDSLGRPIYEWGGRKRKSSRMSRAIAEDCAMAEKDFVTAVTAVRRYRAIGDTANERIMWEKAARICATARELDTYALDAKTRRRRQRKYEEAYSKFREQHGITDSNRRVVSFYERYQRSSFSEDDVRFVEEMLSRSDNDSRVKRCRQRYREINDEQWEQPQSQSQSWEQSQSQSWEQPQPQSQSQSQSWEQPRPQSQSWEQSQPQSQSQSWEQSRPQSQSQSQSWEQSQSRDHSEYHGYSQRRTAIKEAHESTPRAPKNVFSSAFGAVEKLSGLGRFGSFRVTSRPRVGPFVFNLGRQGLSSISLDAGRIRFLLWSQNHRAGFSSVDLPGGLSFSGKRRSKRVETL